MTMVGIEIFHFVAGRHSVAQPTSFLSHSGKLVVIHDCSSGMNGRVDLGRSVSSRKKSMLLRNFRRLLESNKLYKYCMITCNLFGRSIIVFWECSRLNWINMLWHSWMAQYTVILKYDKESFELFRVHPNVNYLALYESQIGSSLLLCG